MAEPDSRAAITKVLRAHRARKVYHVTLARNLLDIVASGGLLSPQERGVQPTHSWGSNADAGTALVCLSFLPSWAMVKHQMQGKELVILAFDALLLENLESAIFCQSIPQVTLRRSTSQANEIPSKRWANAWIQNPI